MAAANQYPKLGAFSIVPAADLTSLTSVANKRSDARVGSDGFGKRAGMVVIRDGGDGAYSMVFATGDSPASTWKVVDNSATYTPA
jgi:hypothetical protein